MVKVETLPFLAFFPKWRGNGVNEKNTLLLFLLVSHVNDKKKEDKTPVARELHILDLRQNQTLEIPPLTIMMIEAVELLFLNIRLKSHPLHP